MANVSGAEPPQIATISVEGDTTVIRVVGEIDLASAATVRTRVDEAVEAGAARIVFDLGAVDFIDSSGLAVLVSALRRTGAVALRNPAGNVRRVVEIAGLADDLPFEAT